MTDDPNARRIAADYLAALDDREAAAFVAEARASGTELRDFARDLFGNTADGTGRANRDLFGFGRNN